MDPRRATLAWTVAAFEFLLLAATLVLAALSRNPVKQGAPDLVIFAALNGPALAYSIVGALIASKRPDSSFGWLCLLVGGVWFLAGVQSAYAAYGLLVRPGSLPAAELVGVFSSWIPGAGLLGTFFLLLFPDSRLPSARWRPVAWLSAISVAALALVSLFSTRTIVWFEGTRNPLVPESRSVLAILDATTTVAMISFFVCIIASVASLFVRYRRASTTQRQQLKWIALAGAAFFIVLVVSFAAWQVRQPSVPVKIAQSLIGLGLALPPLAALMAVLRYGLYDIDRIVSRAVTYAVATVVLGATYAGLVLVLSRATSSFAGSSNLAVAASTLVVAAAFVPLRRRVRDRVDRRFNRARYDAMRTVAEFSARLRDDIDVTVLTDDLKRLVQQTMQPAHVSVWTPAQTGRQL